MIKGITVQLQVTTETGLDDFNRPILEEAMRAESLPMGTILQDPIEGLKEYHKDAIIPTTE